MKSSCRSLPNPLFSFVLFSMLFIALLPLPLWGQTVVGTIPLSGGEVAVYEAGNKLFIYDDATDKVLTYDGGTLAELNSVFVGGHARPQMLVHEASAKLYVLMGLPTQKIAVLNAATGAFIHYLTGTYTLANGSAFMLAQDPGLGKVYAMTFEGLRQIDTATDAETLVVGAGGGGGFEDMAVNPVTHEVFVARFISNQLNVVNGNTLQVTSFPNLGGVGIGVNWIENKVYLTSGGGVGVPYLVFDRDTNTTTNVLAGNDALTFFFNPAGNRMYTSIEVNGVCSIIDGLTNAFFNLPWFSPNTRLGVRQATNRVYFSGDFVGVLDDETRFVEFLPFDGAVMAINQTTGRVFINRGNTMTVVQDNGAMLRPPIYVGTLDNDGAIIVFEPTTKSIVEIKDPAETSFAGAHALAMQPGGMRLYMPFNFSTLTSKLNVFDGFGTRTLSASFNTGGTVPRAVALTPDGSRAYVSNSNSNNVSVVNTANNAILTTVPVGNDPWGVAASPDGAKVYVVNRSSNNVKVISTATNTVTATIAVGSSPLGIALNPGGTRAFVANSGAGTVSVIDLTSNAVVATVPVGSTPHWLAITPDGRHVYVSNQGGGTVSVIATNNNAVIQTITVGAQPEGVAVMPDGSEVLVARASAGGTLTAINTTSFALTHTSIPDSFFGPRKAYSVVTADPTAKFAGRVIPGNCPTSGVLVRVLQGGIEKGTAMTDAAGDYSVFNLKPGTYDLEVSLAGYNPQTLTGQSVGAGRTNVANFNLIPIIPVSCSYSISPTSATFAKTGGTGSVTITTLCGCNWLAVSNDSWITITAGASGTGSGSVNYSVAANPGPQRSGTVTIAGQTFTVTQDSGCTFTITPTNQSFVFSGGNGTVTVTTTSDCAWTATSNAAWITINSGSSGSGSGMVGYTVAINSGLQRSGTITIAGQTFTVTQLAQGELLNEPFFGGIPGNWTIVNGGSGGGTSATWTTANPCNRSIGTPFSSPFAIVDSACAGSSATQDEQLITPTIDASGCSVVILEFSNQFVYWAGGLNEIADVDASTDGGQSWINVFRKQSATDDGWPTPNTKTIDITAAIAANPANVKIRFRYYNGNWEGRWAIDNIKVKCLNCSYSIMPTTQNFPSSGGMSNVSITVNTGCPWTATSNAAWITINSGTPGSGNGTVNYTVAANSGPQRTGTMTVAGQTFTVTQDSGCAFSILPTSQNFAAAGGSNSVAVTSATGCVWTATSNAAWITINSGTPGSGNGTLNYSVAVNSGPQRSGTITVAGQTFTVTQDSGCTFSLLPTSQNFAAAGGSGSTNVTTVAGCAWTATSNAAWITPTVFNGTGSSSVGYLVTANTGPQRSGTMTIAGQTFTVIQDAFVCPAITVNSATAANGFVGTPYAQTFSQTGGSGAIVWSHTGALPNGLALNALTGELAGTPVLVGSFTFTVRATDQNNCFGERQYVVIISGNGLQFYPLAHPIRLVDTRTGTPCNATATQISGNTSLTIPARGTCGGLTIPANAAAVTGNLTTVGPVGPGFLTLYPGDAAKPNAANSNYQTNQTLNNVFTVGLATTDGTFKLYSLSTTHAVIDLTGYFAPPGAGGLFFHPLPAPVRLLDTRAGQTACTTPGTPLLANQEFLQQGNAICGIPATALALVGNATTVGPAAQGFLTMFPADAALPFVASGNYQSGQTLNSPFTVGLSPAGQFKLFSSQQTNLVVDVLGYYSADASDTVGIGLLFTPMTPARLLDTRAGQSACFTPSAAIPASTNTPQAARGTCTIPATAQAIVGNETTVAPAAAGFLTFWPSNAARPNAATSNYAAGVNFNRHYTVGLDTDGAFLIYTLNSLHLVIDVSGSFAP